MPNQGEPQYVGDSAAIASMTGVVVIGRNEGDRLRRCLASEVRQAPLVVYVDSGSTDGSVSLAKSLGAEVVELDPSRPFTAARARNEGFKRLRDMRPELSFVQFVDGDCELCAGWLAKAAQFLGDHEDVAAVSGWLREKYPENSIYNTLCDIEWDTPVGEAKTCGGIAMFRASAFERVQGFRIDLIAGEEPELCVRVRALGWRVWRVVDEMALHDSAMLRFGQWWKRSLRAGHAFAQGAALHGASPERHNVRESYSAWFWALGIPIFALLATVLLGPVGLLTFAVYPIQVVRLALRGRRSARENWLNAAFLVIGKFPGMLGQLQYFARRKLGRPSRLIEYK
jgi:GT2 family glycosyltransferase